MYTCTDVFLEPPLFKILDPPLLPPTTLFIHSGPGGNVLLNTDDYSVGEHDLTITATDLCFREAADVQSFVTSEPLSKCCAFQ